MDLFSKLYCTKASVKPRNFEFKWNMLELEVLEYYLKGVIEIGEIRFTFLSNAKEIIHEILY